MSKPVKVFRAGQAQAAIFEREMEGKHGKFVTQSVALSQNFQKDGEWQNPSLTVIKQQIYNTIKALVQAAEYLGVEERI